MALLSLSLVLKHRQQYIINIINKQIRSPHHLSSYIIIISYSILSIIYFLSSSSPSHHHHYHHVISRVYSRVLYSACTCMFGDVFCIARSMRHIPLRHKTFARGPGGREGFEAVFAWNSRFAVGTLGTLWGTRAIVLILFAIIRVVLIIKTLAKTSHPVDLHLLFLCVG